MEEKMSLLKSLIQLANIDGEMIDRELSFLWAIANQLGIADRGVFESILEDDIAFRAPENEFERIIQFHRLVLVMNIDKNASAAEYQYIKEMGLKLGLNPMAISTVLSEMKKYPNNMMPPDVLIDIFKRHHN